MLRLETKPLVFLVGSVTFASNAAIEKVSAVELHTRLGRPDFQNSAAFRFMDSRRKRRGIAIASIQDEILIVTVAVYQLLVIVICPQPNRSRSDEIERRPLHTAKLSRRNRSRIRRREAIRVDHQL